MKRLKVFVAGPYTAGDVAVNVKTAMDAGLALLDAGHFPFIPHMCHFIHMHSPRPYDTWVAFDNAFLLTCDALLRLSGESPGADAEVQLANDNNIPVFHSVDEFLKINLSEVEKQELLDGMDELAYRHCWRCDPNDYETKRLIEKINPQDQQLWWFCPDCQTFTKK